MKKTLFALGLTSLTSVSHGATIYDQDGTSLSIGGFVEARMQFNQAPNAINIENNNFSTVNNSISNANDDSRFRVSFNGKSVIKDDLYAIGSSEVEFVGKGIHQVRKIYAGIGGNFGILTYGKQFGALGAISNFTDIMPNNGDTAANRITTANRVANTLKYQTNIDQLSLITTYHGKQSTVDTVGQGFAGSLVYNPIDKGVSFGLGYAYERDNVNPYKVNDGVQRLNSYNTMAGLSYNTDNLYLGLLGSAGKHLTTGYYLGDQTLGLTNLDDTVFGPGFSSPNIIINGNPTPLTNVDIGSAKYWGAEAAIAYSIEKWTLQAVYNYGQYLDFNDNNSNGGYLKKVTTLTQKNNPTYANNADFALKYNFNAHFLSYIEYQNDFLKKSEQYYQGNNVWLGAKYSF